MSKPSKTLTARRITSVWQTTPSMIEWLQRERKAAQKIDTVFGALHKGINSSIILLSASCIEGFLRECLQSFEHAFVPEDSFDNRLRHDYYGRVSTETTYAKISPLFRLAMGKPLSELLKDNPINKQVNALFKFRNGIAHGHSLEYRSYSEYKSEPNSWEFEAWGQYKDVEEYLIENKLISKTETGKQDVFTNEIADHFAALVEPYIRCVVAFLPEEQAKSMRVPMLIAFKEKPKWK